MNGCREIVLFGYREEKVFAQFILTKPDDLVVSVVYIDDLLEADDLLALDDDGQLHIAGNRPLTVSPEAAIYHRFFVRRELDLDRMLRLYRAYALFYSFLEAAHPAAMIMNRPRAGVHNFAKVAHLRRLACHGFQVPIAIQSTVPRDLNGATGEWINKGGSGVRTVAAVHESTALPEDGSRMSPPVLVQRRIRGADVRTHFVGLKHVSLQFRTEAVDYRYAEEGGFDVAIEPVALDSSLVPKCWSYMRDERIEFVGFDFKVTNDGEWFLLEANPMPGFSYFDRRLNGAISDLVWGALRRGYSNTGPSAQTIAPHIGLHRRPVLDTGI